MPTPTPRSPTSAAPSSTPGCTPRAFAQLAATARVWRDGGEPRRLPRVEPAPPPAALPRDVFLFFIGGAKAKAPAAAMALQARL